MLEGGGYMRVIRVLDATFILTGPAQPAATQNSECTVSVPKKPKK